MPGYPAYRILCDIFEANTPSRMHPDGHCRAHVMIGKFRQGNIRYYAAAKFRLYNAAPYRLKFSCEDDKLLIISSNSLQSRFWLSEAVLTESRQNLARQMTHYLRMKAHLFRPYASKKGLADIDRFQSELHELLSS